MVANFVADTLFADDKGFNRFVNELTPGHKRTLGDYIKGFINWINKKLGMVNEIDMLEKRYAELFKDAKEVETTTKNEGEVKYSLNVNAKNELHKALYDKTYLGDILLRDETPPIMLESPNVKNKKWQ